MAAHAFLFLHVIKFKELHGPSLIMWGPVVIPSWYHTTLPGEIMRDVKWLLPWYMTPLSEYS